MNTLEWDIFKRIEDLEQDIDTAKPTLKDANTVATFAFGLAFGNMAIRTPKYVKNERRVHTTPKNIRCIAEGVKLARANYA